MGPNEKMLAIRKFTRDAFVKSEGPVGGLNALTDPNMPQELKAAAIWAEEALDLLMSTHDHGYADREEAAKAVLDKIGS